MREIRERLQLSKDGRQFHLTERHCVRPADLTQAILDVEPNIIHFSGHGTRSGSLILEDQNGSSQPVPAHALRALFALFSDRISCVVLNACHSQVQAAAIAESIGYVIAMSSEIADGAAINFSMGFYRALGYKKSVEDAYQFGLTEMRLHSSGDYTVPVLLTNPRMRRRSIKAKQRIERGPHGNHVHTPSMPGRATIVIREEHGAENSCALIDPTSYGTVGDLLDELFSEYLLGTFEPYSYGQSWLLSCGEFQVLAPLAWVATKRRPVREAEPDWQEQSPKEIGIWPGEFLSVISLKEWPWNEPFYGLATNDKDLFKRVSGLPKVVYLERDRLSPIAVDEFDEGRYKFKCVLRDWLSLGMAWQIMVDQGSDSSN